MRRYDEPVQVRLTTGDDGTAVPDAFLWRNRVYVVREVLSTWLESEPWWETARTPGRRAAPERTVWRVEAGAGRTLGAGVYDLAQAAAVPAVVPAMAGTPAGTAASEPVARGASAQDEWWMLCHLD